MRLPRTLCVMPNYQERGQEGKENRNALRLSFPRGQTVAKDFENLSAEKRGDFRNILPHFLSHPDLRATGPTPPPGATGRQGAGAGDKPLQQPSLNPSKPGLIPDTNRLSETEFMLFPAEDRRNRSHYYDRFSSMLFRRVIHHRAGDRTRV